MSTKIKPIIDRNKFIDLAKNVSKTKLFSKNNDTTPIKVNKKLGTELIYNNISLSKEKTKLANACLKNMIQKTTNQKKEFSSKNSIDNENHSNSIKTDANTDNTFTISSDNNNKENSVNFYKINVNLLKKKLPKKKDTSRNSSLFNDSEEDSESIDLDNSRHNLNENENIYRNKLINSRIVNNNNNNSNNNNSTNNTNNNNNSNTSFRTIYLSRIQTTENELNRTSYRDLRKNIPGLFSSCPHIPKSESKDKNLISTDGNIIRNNSFFYKNNENNKGLNKSLNNSYSNLNNSFNNMSNVTLIRLEDLIVLEDKLYKIVESFKNIKDVRRFIVDWWTFYNYTPFKGNFEYFFNEHHEKVISHESCLLEFLSIIIIYEALGEGNISKNDINKLQNLIYWIHQNYLIICDYVLYTINEVKRNLWVTKLKNIVLSKITRKINKDENINLLKIGNKNIMIMIKNILTIFSNSQTMNINVYTYYLNKSQETSINTLNEYFKKKINENAYKKIENFHYSKILNSSSNHNKSFSNSIILSSQINQINQINHNKSKNIPIKEKIPYLSNKKDRKKVFTLVLDLDETLISFRRDENGRGILKPRPYLQQFLSEMSKKYELIIFTAGTKEYADPILDLIDQKKIFFDKRLYRNHAVVKDDIYIKDLSKLGRDLSKVIILDNMPQNYELQKENGIFIRNYYGDDKDDNALRELIPILNKIAKNPKNDVREELKKMKEEIFSKITTNLNG